MATSGVIVLLSGGVDSVTLAKQAEREGVLAGAVFVDYGQPARDQELAAVRAWRARVSVPLYGYRVPGFPLAAMADPTGNGGPRVVQTRNAMLVSLAASRAVAIGASEVWIGVTADDHADYPDCRPVWVAAMSNVLELAYGIKLAAPFSHLLKRQIAVHATAWGVPLDATWSCYRPTETGQPCGTCNACVSTAAALATESSCNLSPQKNNSGGQS